MCKAHNWNATPAEVSKPYPCDRFLPDADDVYFRAIDVRAPATVLFRWLCQLKAAPYSYDWIDNFGRRSPRHLIPGLEELETGQRFMGIFKIVEFERDRHITGVMAAPAWVAVFGRVAGSYAVTPAAGDGSRLVCKLLVRYPEGLHRHLIRRLLPWGDLLMMRKQFLTLKGMAERQARGAAAGERR